MEAIQKIQIIRAKEVHQILSIGRSSLYKRIEDGLLPPSVNLGGRAVGFVESEIQLVLKALVAGKKQNEIKQLVVDLVNQRQSLL
ncbi:helix-turn-helix transcriptional regulator [Psychromonas sp. KJ10-10]|uniref:helix-turn-helix transcriptional regulator n=1 Tax=Psychromonas sp. KJ10-10 TaxID=3391823 RepID=UPI0039B3D210